MKKKILAFAKKLPRVMACLFILTVFLSSFVQVDREEVHIVKTLPAEYFGEYSNDTLSHGKLSEYDWHHTIEVVHFIDGRIDTVIMTPGHEKVLKRVLYYENFEKIQDNFLVDYSKHRFYGDWFSASQNVPSDKQTKVTLRKLSEFKPEKKLIIATVPLAVRKKPSVEDYFSAMREISQVVDVQLQESGLGDQKYFETTRTILQSRKGKPKLRPFLTFAAYKAFGGIGVPAELCALQEAQSLALYCHNWIIDGKMSHVSPGLLTISSFHFSKTCEEFISQLKMLPEQKELLRKKLLLSNEHSYEGQKAELEHLSLDYVLENQWDVHEGVFCSAYEDRCGALNTPYAFSLWSGAYLAGAESAHLQLLWSAGLSLGTGLQMVNDWNDLSPLNVNRFSDLRSGRLTLPYYLDWKMQGTEAEKVPLIKKRMQEEVLHHYKEGHIYLRQIPESAGKDFLERAFDVLIKSTHIA